MSYPDMDVLEKDLEELGNSPLFRLSLASNELFHSNFIHWLLRNPDREVSDWSGRLFCAMIDVGERRIVDAQREKDHHDLVLGLGDDEGKKTRKVIIENKVKSWRDRDQLGAYSEKAREKEELPLLFLLLSMTVPPEAGRSRVIRDSKGGTWRFLSYGELNRSFVVPLRAFAVQKGKTYLSALLEDYSSMIATMTRILEQDLFPDGMGKRVLGSLTPVRIGQLSSVLKEPCRLNAIFEKGLFERLGAMAAGMLKKKAGDASIYRYRDEKDLPEGCFNVSSGYSSSGQAGYLNLVYRCREGLVIGVQIEGGQYRHFISHVDKGISVAKFVDSYFDPDGVDARSVPGASGTGPGMEFMTPSGNSTYKQYCSFEGPHFLYLHASVEDRQMSGILEVAVDDILAQAGKAARLVPRRTRLVPREGRGIRSRHPSRQP